MSIKFDKHFFLIFIILLINCNDNNSIVWKYKTDNNFLIERSPSSDNNSIYFVNDATLYSLLKKGNLKWEYGRKDGEIIITEPSVDDTGNVYVGSSDGSVLALDIEGKLKWKYKINDIAIEDLIFNKSIAVDNNGTIYFGVNDYLFAINLNGELKWKISSIDYDTVSNSENIISASPAIAYDGTIYFGTDISQSLYAINSDGILKWSFTTQARIDSSPAIDNNGSIFFGSQDCYLYALDLNGKLLWKFKASSAIIGSPVISRNKKVFFTDTRSVYSLNMDGSLNWTYSPNTYDIYSTISLGFDGTSTFILFSHHFEPNQELVILNEDGSERDKIDLQYGPHPTNPLLSCEGFVYIGSSKYFYSIDLGIPLDLEAPWPTYKHDEKHSGNQKLFIAE